MSSWTRDTSSSEASEETTLVVRAQGGDQMAFEVLYERYNDRISRYLSRMVGDDGVGCELTQESFVRAWEALPGLRAPARFASWLYRIATVTSFCDEAAASSFLCVFFEGYRGEQRGGREPSCGGRSSIHSFQAASGAERPFPFLC